MKRFNYKGINVAFSYSDLGKNFTRTDDIIKKIKSFANLENGWDFGQGVVPCDEVIGSAIQLYNLGVIQGFEMSARPETNGGIIIGFSVEDDFIYVTVNDNSTFDLVYEKGIGANYDIIVDEEDVSLEYITKTLQNIKSQWFLLEHSISKNMIIEAGDFQATPSRIWEEEYPFLKKDVQEKSATAQYVLI